MRYLRERREALGGYLPARRSDCADACRCRRCAIDAGFALEADGKEMSTTMAFVRLLGNLLKDTALGPRIVPIVADEARTFGMANLFRQVGIYSPVGQLYEPEDAARCCSYREARTGRSSRRASPRPARCRRGSPPPRRTACTAWPMLPFYIYYSMFGFQRVGDLIWAAADQRARGFLLGATAGRTTLCAAKACSTRTARATSSPRRSRTAAPTIPASRRARGDRRSRHAARCWRSRRTSSTTSP